MASLAKKNDIDKVFQSFKCFGRACHQRNFRTITETLQFLFNNIPKAPRLHIPNIPSFFDISFFHFLESRHDKSLTEAFLNL